MIWSHRENTSFHRTVEKVQLLPLGARRLGAALSRSDFSIPTGPQCCRKRPSRFKSTLMHQHKKTDQSCSSAHIALTIGNMSRPMRLGFCQCVCFTVLEKLPCILTAPLVLLVPPEICELEQCRKATMTKIFNKVSEAGHLKYEPHMRFWGGGAVTFFWCQFHAHSHQSLTCWSVPQNNKKNTPLYWSFFGLSGNAVGQPGTLGAFLLLFVSFFFFSFFFFSFFRPALFVLFHLMPVVHIARKKTVHHAYTM